MAGTQAKGMPRPTSLNLHFGPYRSPRYEYSAKVLCEARGEVIVVVISDGPIARPVGRLPGGNSPVLYKSLVCAVRREAACAVARWWGVSPWLVRKWRRALLHRSGDQ